MNNSMTFMMLIFVALMGVQMYLISKQNKKQRQQVMDFQSSLKAGDEIVLTSGIYGVIEEINDMTAMIRVSDNSVIKVERYVIARRPVKNEPEAEEPETENLQ